MDDAVLGYHEHRGEGSITGDIIMLGRKNIVIRTGEGSLEASSWKSSAIHGNCVVISCGTILPTGSVVWKEYNDMPVRLVGDSVSVNFLSKSTEKVVMKLGE